MFFFSKNKYETVEFPFYIDFVGNAEEIAESKECLFIDISFYGEYQQRQMKYYCSFQYYNEAKYDEMLEFIARFEHTIPVKIKIRKDKPKRFKIDLDDMAQKLMNDEIRRFELQAFNVTAGE